MSSNNQPNILYYYIQQLLMKIEWIDGFTISVGYDGHTVKLSANREGLLSLAKQLMTMANEEPGTHIHYEKFNSLEDDSVELIVEKIES